MVFSFLACLSLVAISDMSIEEKVGQLLMPCFHGEIIDEGAKELVQGIKVGGIIYYQWANGLHSDRQVKTLSEDLQELARENRCPIPLFIALDQEGGIVTRFFSEGGPLPGNAALGQIDDADLTQEAFIAIGQTLRSIGVNMNLAPVIDVNSNPKNPVIGIRSFGNDPELVARLGESALRGLKKAGVIPVLKHFPGHGDTSIDSHADLPVVKKSLRELERVEIFPFRKLCPLVDAVMSAHLLIPALDNTACATLSPKVLGYLRKELGFSGMIISDSLVMEAFLQCCPSIEEGANKAVLAGCDLLLLGGKRLAQEEKKGLDISDIKKVHGFLVQAVRKGTIPMETLDRAVQRILRVKETIAPPIGGIFQEGELAKKIAAKALRIEERKKRDWQLKEKKVVFVAPVALKAMLEKIFLEKESDWIFISPSLKLEKLVEEVKEADVLALFAYNAWKNPRQESAFHTLLALQKPSLVFAVKDPIDAKSFEEADLVVTSFSPTRASLEAIYERFFAR